MLAAAAGTSQPILAGLLGLGAAGLAGAVVAMAWSVNARQIRLAELLARRQFILTREPAAPEQPLNGHAATDAALAEVQETLEAVGARGRRLVLRGEGSLQQRAHRVVVARVARVLRFVIARRLAVGIVRHPIFSPSSRSTISFSMARARWMRLLTVPSGAA